MKDTYPEGFCKYVDETRKRGVMAIMDKEAAIFLFFTRLPAAWGVKVVLSPLVHVIASRDGTTCFSDDERPGQINNRGFSDVVMRMQR